MSEQGGRSYDQARATIFSGRGVKLREELYKVEGWDGLEVLIISMKMGDRAAFQKLLRPQGQKGPTSPLDKVYFDILRRTVHDPETRRPLFVETDFERFKMLDPEPLDELTEKVIKVCGLNKEAVDQEKED